MLGLDQFDYALPDSAIAQTPTDPRDSAKLLDGIGPQTHHRQVRDLVELIQPGDVIVVNDTRVIPARLGLFKETGGAVEVMLLDEHEASGHGSWRALVRPGRRVKPGTVLHDDDGSPVVAVHEDLGDGVRRVEPAADETLLAVAHRVGAVPSCRTACSTLVLRPIG